MCKERPAFGERLEDIAELGVIEFRPEPVDALLSGVSKRSGQRDPVRTVVKTASTYSTTLRESGVGAVTGNYVHAWDTILRFGARSWRVPHRLHSLRRYASQHQSDCLPPVAVLQDAPRPNQGVGKQRSFRAFRLSGRFAPRPPMAPHRSMKRSRYAQNSKDKIRRGKGLITAAHPRED